MVEVLVPFSHTADLLMAFQDLEELEDVSDEDLGRYPFWLKLGALLILFFYAAPFAVLALPIVLVHSLGNLLLETIFTDT